LTVNLACPEETVKENAADYHYALKPRIRCASQAWIVSKYAGTSRCNDVISALFPTFAEDDSPLAGFATCDPGCCQQRQLGH
jgi:hypothetical protein